MSPSIEVLAGSGVLRWADLEGCRDGLGTATLPPHPPMLEQNARLKPLKEGEVSPGSQFEGTQSPVVKVDQTGTAVDAEVADHTAACARLGPQSSAQSALHCLHSGRVFLGYASLETSPQTRVVLLKPVSETMKVHHPPVRPFQA